MNLGTIVGLIVGLALMGLAAWKGAGAVGVPITSLWDYVSVLIVFGGSLAATAIAFKMSQVLHIFRLLKMSKDTKYKFLTEEREKFFRLVGRNLGEIGLVKLFFMEISGWIGVLGSIDFAKSIAIEHFFLFLAAKDILIVSICCA